MENRVEKKWYVVNTYSGHENKVKINLERRIESMNMQIFPAIEVNNVGKKNSLNLSLNNL